MVNYLRRTNELALRPREFPQSPSRPSWLGWEPVPMGIKKTLEGKLWFLHVAGISLGGERFMIKNDSCVIHQGQVFVFS